MGKDKSLEFLEVVRFKDAVLVTFQDGVIAKYSATLLRRVLGEAEIIPDEVAHFLDDE